MRKFYSKGPVNPKEHYSVPRKELVEKCSQFLVGDPKNAGYYFTLSGARKTGKTWLYRQSLESIKHQYGDQFCVGEISMQEIVMKNDDNDTNIFFSHFIKELKKEFKIQIDDLQSWGKLIDLFRKKKSVFDRPLILVIDEFDTLPFNIINNLLSLFREMYLNRKSYLLHGLALVGIHSVFEGENTSGSPFNVQRYFHIEHLSFGEVKEIFDQYQKESSQRIEPDVIENLYKKTQGQPGLTGWFGELLTDKYNQNRHKTIDIEMWNHVYVNACEIEHNDIVQNIVSKAMSEYQSNIINLFTDSYIHFSLSNDWCNYLLMHGIIRYDDVEEKNMSAYICRFSSPFIQTRLFHAFIDKIKENQAHAIHALDPQDSLEDVITNSTLNVPALLKRYKDYLARLKDSGLNPRQNQRRIEAIGHFHLYHWIKMALGIQLSIRPELSIDSGTLYLHIKYEAKMGIIEINSFTTLREAILERKQAAAYAKQSGYSDITIAMFAPITDEHVINQLSVNESINGINVHVVVIGQG
jgi:hypothetical protein